MGELEAIKERHQPDPMPYDGHVTCERCGFPWPCDTAVALAEVERLRAVVEERDREIEHMVLRYGMRQQSALGGEDG